MSTVTATRSDLRPSPRRPDDALTELGAGILDLDDVIDALAERDYDGWLIVVQDTTWGPLSESAAIERRVLATALHRLGPSASHGTGG